MRTFLIAGLVLGGLARSQDASAELVFFASGRNLSVAEHHFDGSSIVLRLRSGGEIVCDRSLITEIQPDEVPYPEPVVETASASPGGLQATPYADLISAVSAEQGVDANLVRAMIQVESGYRPSARSRKGAMGLMQLMPETARQYSVTRPFDPRANLEGGVKHLKTLLERFELSLALAAYNAGEAAVRKFGGIPPYRETRGYVNRVMHLAGR